MVPSRWLAFAALALLATAGVAVGLGGEAGPIPVANSICYGCHAGDNPPLRAMSQLITPDTTSAKIGSSFDYAVTVQNVWEAEFRYTAPVIDLGGAPSLQFSPSVPDYDNATDLVVQFPTDPTVTQGSASADFAVPGGASSLTVVLTPGDASSTSGPDVTLTVSGGSAPAQTINAAQGGGAETFTASGADAAAYSGVLLHVGATVPRVDSGSVPPRVFVTPVPVTVEVRAKFDLTGLTKLAQPIAQVIPAHGSAIVSWPLKVAGEPGANEVVRLWVNTTAFFKHARAEAPDQPNWGNFTEPDTRDQLTPLVLTVTKKGDNLVLAPQGGTTIVRPTIQNGATMATLSEAIGYASAFLLVSSIWSGGMFGKASRRSLNSVFGSAKRRVAFHNFLSYGIILAAVVHMVLFLIESFYDITLGLIWGGVAILAMLGLGVTGALQVPMIRKWSYGSWRWTHYGMTIAVILFTILHMLLDGVHFADVQSALHWTNPFPTTGGSA